MFSIVKNWKEHRIFLPSLHEWLGENAGSNYKGLSADTALTIWFEDDPGSEIETAVDAHWDTLTEIVEEAKWNTHEGRVDAVEAAKTYILTASFDDLNVAERKLLMNLALTDDDKDTLVTKHLS